MARMAKRIGFTVFATASARICDYVKALTVHKCFDYEERGMVDGLVSCAEKGDLQIVHGHDAIPEGVTLAKTASAVGKTRGCRESELTHVLHRSREEKVSKGVELHIVRWRLPRTGPKILNTTLGCFMNICKRVWKEDVEFRPKSQFHNGRIASV